MKQLKRMMSLLLAVVMVFTLLPAQALAVEGSGPVISVESVTAAPGKTVDVNVVVTQNTGILGATLILTYDEGLTLTGATAGEAFSYLTMTKPGKLTSPCTFIWDGLEYSESDLKDGVIMTLTFEVAEGIEDGEKLNVSVEAPDGDIYDNDLNVVNVSTNAGVVTVVSYVPGDVNRDQEVTMADTILLRRYLVGTSDTTIHRTAGNVNGDYKLNTADLIYIRRYLAGGYGVILQPSPISLEHLHTMEAVAHLDPTCTEPGNIAYWHCTDCGKYYSDEYGVNEITLEDTVLAALGHKPEVIPAVEPTETTEGWTEGSKCSECDVILVAPEPIPVLEPETRTITYNIANGDTYLASLDIENLNPTTLKTTESDPLDNNPSVPGYRFLGWYDLASGPNAEIVKQIEPGEENITLYAHWEKISYTIQFKSPLYPIDSITYTVDAGAVLPTPRLSNYVFTGWSDEDGHLYSQTIVPVGSTGNLILVANWMSERNKTVSKTTLDDPLIYEDEENQTIYFTYEIGKVENVPLRLIKNFGYISEGGVSKSESITYSISTTEEMMTSYTSVIEKATTASSSWTLSEDWNVTTDVSRAWCEENGISYERAKEIGTSDTQTWNVSSQKYGATEVTNASSDTNGWQAEAKVNGSKTDITTEKRAVGLETTVGAKVGAEYMGVSSEISASVTASGNKEWESSSSETSGFEYGGSINYGGMSSETATSTSGWNTSSAYESSKNVSINESTTSALTNMISEEYSYGQSYVSGEESSETQGLESTQASSDEYTNSVTYSRVTGEDITRSWTTQATKSGYHRWILAGTAHVFAVVGYDMRSQSFFVNTISIMDDETHEFEDYSYTTDAYDDQENGVITFEVPDEIVDYIDDRTIFSAGLKVDQDTGLITQYTGSDTCVIIPEYMNVGNGKVVKITGIGGYRDEKGSYRSAFQGNTNIKGVVLSDFITAIPDNAFAGCTNLEAIGGGNITSIGANAFAGCTLLQDCAVNRRVTFLGEKAFDGVDRLLVNASNVSVAQNAVTSGAKKIELYINDIEGGTDALSGLTFTPAEETESFEFNGYGKTYTGLSIDSNTATTIINNADFIGTDRVPLCFSSTEVVLNDVTVKSTGYSLVLSGAQVNVGLQGTITLTSEGENTVLCRNPSFYEHNQNVVGMLTPSDKMIVCGTLSGSRYVECSNIEYVDQDMFENLLTSYKLTFDANGGTCDTQSVEVSNGVAIGELPVPTREYFTFEGWYTEAEGGELVTAETAFSSGTDVTIYAHWAPNEYTATWTEEKGTTIAVERTASPYAEAELGALESGAVVYYGDVLSVTYAPATGFELGECGETEITVSGDVTEETIFAHASGLAYTVSWETGTGYTITVNRTESPNYGAETGALDSGDTVYYGDVLEISYAASTGYTLGECGETEITVTGDVTGDSIHASATANNYTYTVVYRSSNGTNLGSTTVTKPFGTTFTISAPAKSGYNTPASQTIKWDSVEPKTITFTYGITSVATSQGMSSGNWYIWSGKYGITYSASAEYRNRTASSVQIRVKWTNSITANTWYGFAQYFTANIGGTSTGEVQIVSSSTWAADSSSSRSATVYSGWITVPVSATSRSVSVSATFRDINGKSGSWSKTMTIPTY